jgi:hypothetical protein
MILPGATISFYAGSPRCLFAWNRLLGLNVDRSTFFKVAIITHWRFVDISSDPPVDSPRQKTVKFVDSKPGMITSC